MNDVMPIETEAANVTNRRPPKRLGIEGTALKVEAERRK
jgi:hypothetical protein